MRYVLALLFALCLAPAPAASAGLCFFQYETVSGLNKTCVYDCMSGQRSITISAVQLCPLTIQD